jgi:hypothetical protein
MRHSLLAASFGERETRVKDVRSRTPASPVLRILDPRRALAIFAAKSQRRDIDRRRHNRQTETELNK